QRMRVLASGRTPDEGEIARSLAAADKCLAALERLTSAGPFLIADRLTLADLHAYPMLRYLSLAPEGHALLLQYAKVARWHESMQRRASVVATRSSLERD